MNRFALVLATLLATGAQAELVYQPVNPNFGGNPLNASGLLSNANSQNDFDDPDIEAFERPTDLERLVSSLESRLLSQLLSDVGEGQSGSFTTDNFSVEVIDNGTGGLELNIVDLVTGDSTSISVDGLIID